MFPEKIRKNEAVLLLILIVLCLTLFFFRLGARPLWDIDESKHAVTSKEMILSHDWITPKFNCLKNMINSYLQMKNWCFIAE